jgi:hypothetical protein
MGRITRLTERDLTRLVRRVIKENKTKKKPVNEGLNDYLTLIGGTLVSFAAIKLFGRKILVQLFGLFSKGLINATCYKELESIMELISKDTDNLQVEYKKIKDYYQIIIDMKSFSSEYSFTDTKDYKVGQLDSYNFPAKLKLYDDGTVEYLCNTGEVIREKSKGNIYDNFVNFIKSYGEENPKIRGHAEDKEIFKVLNKTLKPNFQSKVEQYNSLASMDSNVIDKMASEISKELDIPQELIANAMERHQPTEMKDEETISTDRYYSPIWDFINDVYKDITESNNNESLKESDLTRIVKRVIQENKSIMKDLVYIGATLSVPIIYLASQNEVEVVDRNGDSKEPKNGEVFTGKVVKMKPYGSLNANNNPTGYDIIIKTKKGETIDFRVDYSKKNENVRVGDTIKIKYNDDTYFWDPSIDIQ